MVGILAVWLSNRPANCNITARLNRCESNGYHSLCLDRINPRVEPVGGLALIPDPSLHRGEGIVLAFLRERGCVGQAA